MTTTPAATAEDPRDRRTTSAVTTRAEGADGPPPLSRRVDELRGALVDSAGLDKLPTPDDESPFFRRGRCWGPWHLDRPLRTLTEVLHPQANLCSFGRSQRLSKPQVRYLVGQARVSS